MVIVFVTIYCKTKNCSCGQDRRGLYGHRSSKEFSGTYHAGPIRLIAVVTTIKRDKRTMCIWFYVDKKLDVYSDNFFFFFLSLSTIAITLLLLMSLSLPMEFGRHADWFSFRRAFDFFFPVAITHHVDWCGDGVVHYCSYGVSGAAGGASTRLPVVTGLPAGGRAREEKLKPVANRIIPGQEAVA